MFMYSFIQYIITEYLVHALHCDSISSISADFPIFFEVVTLI